MKRTKETQRSLPLVWSSPKAGYLRCPNYAGRLLRHARIGNHATGRQDKCINAIGRLNGLNGFPLAGIVGDMKTNTIRA